jgi:hypothetical protein
LNIKPKITLVIVGKRHHIRFVTTPLHIHRNLIQNVMLDYFRKIQGKLIEVETALPELWSIVT